jgi:hypothetical protein
VPARPSSEGGLENKVKALGREEGKVLRSGLVLCGGGTKWSMWAEFCVWMEALMTKF